MEEAIAKAEANAGQGGGHGGPPGGRGGPPGGHRGPPGGHRGPPPGGPGGFDPVEMFDTQDVNKDDKLTGDEIPDEMRERLEFVDTDENGEVSREEIEALAERFRRGPPGRGGPGGRGGGRGGPPGGGRGGPGGGHGGADGGHAGDDAGSQPARPQRPE